MINVTVTLNYPPADLEILKAQAAAANQTVEDFIIKASMRSANNAAYLAKLKKADEEIRQGKVVKFTDEEWEKFINA